MVIGLLGLAGCAGDLGGHPPATTDPLAVTTTVPVPAPPATDVLDPDDPDPDITDPASGLATRGVLGLADWPCPPGMPAEAVCHHLGVPVDATEPTGAVATLPVAVLPARTSPADGAVVVLADGPGRSGLAEVAAWAESPLRDHHDLVLYDQRGTGSAEPSLDCIERDNAFVDALQAAGDPRTEAAAVRYGLIVCRDRITSTGVDITEFDTEAASRDLTALRVALGYDRWDVLGQGAGSRVALAAVAAGADGIRSLVLDGVADGPTTFFDDPVAVATQILPTVVASCAAVPACDAAHPDLAAHLAAVLARPFNQVIDVTVDVGDGAGDRHLVLDRDDLLFGVVLLLTDPVALPTVPSVLDALATGDISVVPDLVRRSVATFTRRADAVSDTFSGTPDSDVPTLILGGAFDPVTPEAGMTEVARHLTRSTTVVFAHLGHGVIHDPCATTIALAFLADPAEPGDQGCTPGPRQPAWT